MESLPGLGPWVTETCSTVALFRGLSWLGKAVALTTESLWISLGPQSGPQMLAQWAAVAWTCAFLANIWNDFEAEVQKGAHL